MSRPLQFLLPPWGHGVSAVRELPVSRAPTAIFSDKRNTTRG